MPNMSELLRRTIPGAMSSDLRRSLRNAGCNSAEQMLHPLLWLIATPIFIAGLGGDLFGVWVLVQSMLGFSQLFGLGLTTAITRFLAKYRGREEPDAFRGIIETTGWMYMILGFVAALLTFLLRDWLVVRVIHPPAEYISACSELVALVSAGILVRFFYSVCQSALQGFERHDLAARVGMYANATMILVNIVLVVGGHGLREMVLVVIACNTLGGIAMWLLLRWNFVPGLSLRPQLDGDVIREVWEFGFFNGVRAVVGNLGNYLELFIVSAVLDSGAVGVLGVARRLPLQVHALVGNAMGFLFPFSGTLFERSDDVRLRRVYDKATTAVVIIVSGLLLPILLFGPDFLALWIDPEFAGVARVALLIYCVRYALLPMTIVNHHYLLGAGLAALQAAIVGIVSGLVLLAVWIMTPRYGIEGAAIATLVDIPAVFLTRLYVERRIFGRASLTHNLGYLFAATVPLMIAGIWWSCRSPDYIAGWVAVLGLMALTCALAWMISSAMTILLQRLRLLPNVLHLGSRERVSGL